MNSAREYAARLADLLSRERFAMAEFLLALADFDRRKLWESLGHTGLFPFLHRELGLSKAAAFYRKTAAELVQRFPEIVEPLRDGRLCMTAIGEVAKVITPENKAKVLPRFFHCSSREAKQVAAEIAPSEAPPRREVVTVIRLDPPSPERTVPAPEPTHSEIGAGGEGPAAAPPPPAAPARKPDGVEPLTAELSRLHVTVSRRFLAKLDRARDALSHSHPGASAEAILEAGLDLLLARDAKRKGLVAKPRAAARAHTGSPAETKNESRRIPASVKRAVWIRDQGRCQYPLESGEICGSTHRLQFDHVHPRALGGPPTVDNVRITCALHNDLAARIVFGEEWMESCKRREWRPQHPPPP
ncbi:MAG TPA: HNH endonuclease [Anaeromyxobacteraceae bacterium]|nr:HNH endonuclease [Anaeromyxobacteraceae bacterium]